MTQMEFIPLKTADGQLYGHARVRGGFVLFSLREPPRGRALILTASGSITGEIGAGIPVSAAVEAVGIEREGRLCCLGLSRTCGLTEDDVRRRMRTLAPESKRAVRQASVPPRVEDAMEHRHAAGVDDETPPSARAAVDDGAQARPVQQARRESGMPARYAVRRVPAKTLAEEDSRLRTAKDASEKESAPPAREAAVAGKAFAAGTNADAQTDGDTRREEIARQSGLNENAARATRGAEQGVGGEVRREEIVRQSGLNENVAREAFFPAGLRREGPDAAESVRAEKTEAVRNPPPERQAGADGDIFRAFRAPESILPRAASETASALAFEPKRPLTDPDTEAFFALLRRSDEVYRSIYEDAAPRAESDPLPFTRTASWHGEVDALIGRSGELQRVGVPNPFPHIFPNATFVKLTKNGLTERLEGDWRRGGERFTVFAVPGSYSPMPPPELKGYTRYIRSRAGGFWVRVTDA